MRQNPGHFIQMFSTVIGTPPEGVPKRTYGGHLPGAQVTVLPGRFKLMRKGYSLRALRFRDLVYSYQLTADVGLAQARKEVVASRKNSWRIEIKYSERKNC